MAGPQVETIYGVVEGTQESDLNVFKGIPYAKPPIGELRWCAPQPPEGWDGVMSCIEFSAVCAQEDDPVLSEMKINKYVKHNLFLIIDFLIIKLIYNIPSF